jgi:PQQ-like domain
LKPVLRHGARLLVAALVPLVLAAGAGSTTVAAPAVTGWLTYGNAPTRTGDAASTLDPGRLRAAWYADLDGVVTTQPLVARNVPAAGQSTVYVGTSTGLVEALAPNGYTRWTVQLGVFPQTCEQLPTWGVTGTPVIDAVTHAIYVADGFGWLHALDLATGRERTGWPVRLYDDPSEELVWGALLDVKGSVYAGTGSYCDRPMIGKLVRVDLDTGQTTSWTSVPPSLGGGGGIWGWGGAAYSAADDRLFAVTGNAFEGGGNSGAAFTESAGYAEHLVELTRDLTVVAASHPTNVPSGDDSDFVGSPVLAAPPGCGELVGAANKNGDFYVWHGEDVAAGPFVAVSTQPTDFDNPVLTNPAYDAASRAFFVVTARELVRIAVAGDCSASVAWRATLPTTAPAGSPTIAGGVVWLAQSGGPALLLGYDARTGALRFRRALGVVSFAAPTVVDGRLFDDGRHGFADAGARASLPAAGVGRAPGLASWLDSRHGWVSRENGVFATNDGRRWRRVYPLPAQRVVRTSRRAGLISVGAAPTACDCTGRRLFTRDGGRTWHAAASIGPAFAGRGSKLVWWSGSTLHAVPGWPAAARSRTIVRFDATIADAAVVPGGEAVLLTRMGSGSDATPGLALVHGKRVTMLTLPSAQGTVLARGLSATWPAITVRGVTVDGPSRQITWTSADGGRTWTLRQPAG